MSGETIPDIIGELNLRASFAHSNGDETVVGDGRLPQFLWDYSNRLEVAYARLPLLTPAQWTEFARQGQQLVEMKREAELLRNALRHLADYISREEWADRNLAALADEAEVALNGGEANND